MNEGISRFLIKRFFEYKNLYYRLSALKQQKSK